MTGMQLLATALATCGGTGYFPLAPGTVGSFVAAVMYFVMGIWLLPLPGQLVVVAVFTLIGWWAAGNVSARTKNPDPKQVVIDEWVGVWLVMALLPFELLPQLLGFVLFRIIDILKPWPISLIDRMPGAGPIMADDIAAALLTTGLIHALLMGISLS